MSHRIRSLKLVKRLVEEETLTTIAILHDLNLAYAFSDKVIVLKEGTIHGHDEPKKLMTESFIQKVFDVNVHHVEDKGLIVIP